MRPETIAGMRVSEVTGAYFTSSSRPSSAAEMSSTIS